MEKKTYMLLGGCHFDRISSMLVGYLTHCCISVCRGVDETRRKRWVKGTLQSAAGGYSFTGLICPEWCLTPLKAHILPMHLNLGWIFCSTRRPTISQVPPSGGGGGDGEEEKKRRMRREEEDLGLPPSPAFVSSSCLLMQRLPISSSQSTPHLLHPAPEPSPGGFLSTSHRQGVRRNCNWNTDYMNNEPETTRMTRNRDQGLRW